MPVNTPVINLEIPDFQDTTGWNNEVDQWAQKLDEAAQQFFKWGQRWEWTESAYLPYPNYKKADGALGEYNGKFMVNQKILRGSSVATPIKHSRPSYRNFFPTNLRW